MLRCFLSILKRPGGRQKSRFRSSHWESHSQLLKDPSFFWAPSLPPRVCQNLNDLFLILFYYYFQLILSLPMLSLLLYHSPVEFKLKFLLFCSVNFFTFSTFKRFFLKKWKKMKFSDLFHHPNSEILSCANKNVHDKEEFQ